MKRKIFTLFSAILALCLISSDACAVTNIRVGAGSSNQSIAAAIAAAGDITGSGGLVLELQSDYNQSSEIIGAILGASSSDPVTIRPALSLSLTSVDWTLDGCSYVTIDGRVGSIGLTKALTLANTSTSGVTLKMINSATNNTVKYVTLQGVNTAVSGGVVVFGVSVGNAIDNCDIRDITGTGTPVNGIYSESSSANTISNCNIYNYYHISAGCNGIYLKTAVTGWTIKGNSFYNTGSVERSFTGGYVSAITIDNISGNGFIVTNNFIGGQQPLCAGGKDLMGISTTGSAGGLIYKGIYMNLGATVTTSVQGNTIQNIAVATGAGINTTLGDNAALITINNGAVDFGTTTGNQIGSQTGTGNITFNDLNNAAKQSLLFGIRVAGSAGAINIKNNSIGGITMVNNAILTGSLNLNIINIEGTRTTDLVTIEGNTIGNSSTGNTDGAQMSLQNFTKNSRGTKAISVNATGSIVIKDNLLANIYGSNVSNAGINCLNLQGAASYTISGNTIRDLISGASCTDSRWINSMIYFNGSNTKANVLIYGNTLYNFSCTHASGSKMDGITIYAGTANTSGATVYNNKIYNIIPTAALQYTSGIRTTSNNTLSSIYNNLIRLGFDKLGNAITTDSDIRGIYEETSGATDVNYNSVYIGGTGVTAATKGTYAYYSNSTATATRLIENNIFENVRTGSSGKHYAVRLSNATNTTINFNDYISTSGYLCQLVAVDNIDLTTWKTSVPLDANSISVIPVFAGETSITPDFHLFVALGNNSSLLNLGTPISGVTVDFDGDPRSLTAPTMGADENGVTVLVATPAEFGALNTSITTALGLYSGSSTNEGNLPGQYPATSRATLQSAITVVQAVSANANSTSAQVNSAKATLDAAIIVFNNSLIPPAGSLEEFDALAAAISSAQVYYTGTISKEGSSLGQYYAASRTTFAEAISTAQTIHGNQYSSSTQLNVSKSSVDAATSTFRNSVNTSSSNLTTGAYYYISVSDGTTDYYLTDVNPGVEANTSNGVQSLDYELKKSGSDQDYQIFKFTFDEVKGRYRVDGKSRLDDAYTNTYVAEGCAFGKNNYDNAWNTLSVLFDGTKYAISKAEKSTGYWYPSNLVEGATTLSEGVNLYNSFVYKIVNSDFGTGVSSSTESNIIIYSANGLIKIDGISVQKVLVYDMTGRVVKTVTGSVSSVAVPQGQYIVKAISNEVTKVEKLIVR